MKLIPILFIPVLLVISACSTPAKLPPQQQPQPNAAATSNAVPLVAAVAAVAAIPPQPASESKTVAAAQSRPAATPPVAALTSSQSTAVPATATRDELLAAWQKKSIYFDFDKSNIKPEFLERVRQAANILNADNQITVVLEGHADERGSSEYNLALGTQRANAVKNALRLSGIPANRVQTVSLGEEKPRLTCAEEKCWQENRRVDFIFKSGK